MENKLELGDIVLCIVDRIDKTTVFVKIQGFGEEIEGSIVLSEIAPGRIRNLRDYVVPKKQIICKVLRINGNRIELSLRRVTPKEQKELKEKNAQEKSYKNIIKSIIGENSDKIIREIEKEKKFYNFIEDSKENSKKLEELIGETNSKKFLEIINNQKQKEISLKKQIELTTKQSNGIELIKQILNIKNIEIKYLGGGNYSLRTEDKDIKTADNKLKKAISEIEEKAKKLKLNFLIKEK